MSEVRTKRLLLRPVVDGDLASLHAILRNPEVMRYWATLPHQDVQQTRDWIVSNRAEIIAGTEIEFVVEFDGRLIGRVAIWQSEEIGYLFDPAYWHRGFAREAVTGLLDVAFSDRGWTKVTAEVDPRNTSSLRLLEQLGFHWTDFQANAYCVGDRWMDSLGLALQKADWLARRQGRANPADEH
jgi:RimJ/RimL family protein N-acetyltransferase